MHLSKYPYCCVESKQDNTEFYISGCEVDQNTGESGFEGCPSNNRARQPASVCVCVWSTLMTVCLVPTACLPTHNTRWWMGLSRPRQHWGPGHFMPVHQCLAHLHTGVYYSCTHSSHPQRGVWMLASSGLFNGEMCGGGWDSPATLNRPCVMEHRQSEQADNYWVLSLSLLSACLSLLGTSLLPCYTPHCCRDNLPSK